MKKLSFFLSMYLLPALAFAARTTGSLSESKGIPMQILDAGFCMVSECGVLTLIFVIVPAVAVYIYKRYIVVG